MFAKFVEKSSFTHTNDPSSCNDLGNSLTFLTTFTLPVKV